MPLGTIGGILAGGLGVAIFNQFGQWGRDTVQRKSENKSLLMREKLKIIYELNSELRDFDNLAHSAYNIINKYMSTPLENRDTEIEKIGHVDKEINNTQISNEHYLKNLHINLSYFPNIDKNIKETKIYNLQRRVITGYLSIDGIENSYSLSRIQGNIRKDLEEIYENDYVEYVKAYQLITNVMKEETQKIIKYLE
ncbi:hypothetical protein [Staphylococcus saprophyticus]|uniref:hypothetical protein n=1 Tax=Staphylococcus saprophyticus TaxID=29385 RepID=UPI0011A217F0|nr:hypothetical protein [Staphylococcus saprophyticus]MDW4144019.1 hypothetical protein [Staphylococcus saprophyticus]